jgi:DNA adenine methylase
MKLKKYESPLRYPGGKSRHIKHLAPLLPAGIKEFREPFCGGASMFFHVRSNNLSETYWINDKFGPVANYWIQVACRPSLEPILQDAYMMLEKWTPEQVRSFAEKAKVHLNDPKYGGGWCAYALYFFIVNRCSFSGSTLSGGFSPGNTRFIRSSIDNMKAANEALEGVRITGWDYSRLILEPGEDVFLFLDPPYFTAKKLYGRNGDMHDFNDADMARLLRETPHRWMLTYDDCPEIRALYDGFHIREIPVTGSMNNCGKEKKQKRVKELVITNYTNALEVVA